jgi:resuscitation-promoting factor RpfA
MPGVDEDALMLGGGALALLALGGAAVAMRRRRRRHDEEVMADDYAVHEEIVHEPAPVAVTPRHDPAHSSVPPMVAPAFFARNDVPVRREAVSHDSGRGQDETWVERAHRGPTPDNPSLSLRKRLKRAAFFDARERQVVEGRAEPVPMDAGLPGNVTVPAPRREREHEFA